MTGILPLVDMKMIVAVGWSRKITVYDDSDPDVSLFYDFLYIQSVILLFVHSFMHFLRYPKIA